MVPLSAGARGATSLQDGVGAKVLPPMWIGMPSSAVASGMPAQAHAGIPVALAEPATTASGSLAPGGDAAEYDFRRRGTRGNLSATRDARGWMSDESF